MKKVNIHNSFLSLAAENLRNGQSVRLLISGESMYPFIRGGADEVTLAPYVDAGQLYPYCCLFYHWQGHYMIHRYLGSRDGKLLLMGDGNLVRVEEVDEQDVYGVLTALHRPDGSTLQADDERWIKKARWWYRLRKLRRFLIPLLKRTIG